MKITKYFREDSANIFVGNQTESYIGRRFMAGVSSYISLNRFAYLSHRYQTNKGGSKNDCNCNMYINM